LPVLLRLGTEQPDHLLLSRQAAERRNLEFSRHLGQFFSRLCIEFRDCDMRWATSGWNRLLRVGSPVSWALLVLPEARPAISAVSSIAAKTLRPIGAIALRPGTALATTSTIAAAVSRPGINSAIEWDIKANIN
jgi:hypothetical protein